MRLVEPSRGARHTFAVTLPSGERKPGLYRSFIQERQINFSDTIVECEDRIWSLYVEPRLLDLFCEREDVKCVVSFQGFKDGEHIAVAREWKPRNKNMQRKLRREHTIGEKSCL